MEVEELDQLLLRIAVEDLADGADINDHPAELARQTIKALRKGQPVWLVKDVTPSLRESDTVHEFELTTQSFGVRFRAQRDSADYEHAHLYTEALSMAKAEIFEAMASAREGNNEEVE